MKQETRNSILDEAAAAARSVVDSYPYTSAASTRKECGERCAQRIERLKKKRKPRRR